MVLGGLAANVMIKERRKARRAAAPAVAGVLEAKLAAGPDGTDVESGTIGEEGAGAAGVGVGADGGGGVAAGHARSAAAKGKRDRAYIQQQRQNGAAGNGGDDIQDGLLQSWRPRLGGRLSPWRTAAEVPSAGDGSGRAITFGDNGDGEATEPLLVSKGRGSSSSGR